MNNKTTELKGDHSLAYATTLCLFSIIAGAIGSQFYYPAIFLALVGSMFLGLCILSFIGGYIANKERNHIRVSE